MKKSTPKGKGFRTGYQSFLAVASLYLYGLWNLPGVSEYTYAFIKQQGPQLLIQVGLPVGVLSGLYAWYQNKKGL